MFIKRLFKSRHSARQAYTLIELLAVMFVVAVTAAVEPPVAKKYGVVPGIGAAFLTVLASAGVVVLFYRWSWCCEKRTLRKLREKYQTIYRVTDLPSDQRSIIKPDGAEIKIGDHGWEAGPIRKNGLIYLQGLTLDWRMVWYAGFRPDQIERVATKPSSQYDHWAPYWAKRPPLPPCPFPVLERETLTIGIPHHSHRVFTRPIPYHPVPAEKV
jgi:prepilin-type N-terminal cleavage/methylation domain-containing protein